VEYKPSKDAKADVDEPRAEQILRDLLLDFMADLQRPLF